MIDFKVDVLNNLFGELVCRHVHSAFYQGFLWGLQDQLSAEILNHL